VFAFGSTRGQHRSLFSAQREYRESKAIRLRSASLKLCGAQTPQKRTNGWRGGGGNAARRARNCTGVISRT